MKRKRRIEITTADLPDDVYDEALYQGLKARMKELNRLERPMHITTNVGRYHISTNWVEAMDMYETMVFEYDKANKIDWSGLEQWRTKSVKKAIKHHTRAIASYAKNA